MAAGPLDLLVAGGGIVGAGIVRDAAMRGLRAALVEQHDFAFGTSSRSSRLLHGGLRYLAQGRIGLVHEASTEKLTVRRIAPHLSAPLAFVLPTYRCAPWAPWALWKLRIGVRIYDWLCGGRNFGDSSGLDPRQTISLLPGINPQGLTGGVRYFDGLTNDARLVLDSLRSAAKAGGLVANYCRLAETREESGGWRCVLRDRVTGRAVEASARCVVNATGPWSRQFPQGGIELRLTKGVHLVVDRARLPVPDAVVMTEGKRILFAIPWGERVILGTTDTDYAGPLDDVRTEPDDVRYILRAVNAAFPAARLAEADVIADWAGLRPLIATPGGGPSDVSRSHEIRMSRPGWFDMAGGKLTTYRLMAEQAVDRIEEHLGRTPAPCTTAETPLLDPAETEGVSGIVPPGISDRAVGHYCRNEWAVHLDDVMRRRTGWHFYHRDAGAVAERVAGWMGDALGWGAPERQAELERYRRHSGSAAACPGNDPQPAVEARA